ncbi:MAG: hypothetical protein MUC34_08605 [Anaerolineae bacterium]|jgi:hypothetical protein|nr:hypothetical protein [Anaerolineae bacterium]
MDAMDWPALLRGALWITGLSIALASFSHMRWTAKQEGVPLRMAVSWDSFLAPFFAGLTLFAAGMAWGAQATWEAIAWAVIAVIFIAQVGWSVRSARRGLSERSESHETH